MKKKVSERLMTSKQQVTQMKAFVKKKEKQLQKKTSTRY